MKKYFASAFFATLVSATTAQAAEITSIPFNDLDTNHNDFLSTDEVGVLPDIETQWGTLDKDNDGQLNRAEYAGYQMPAPAAGNN